MLSQQKLAIALAVSVGLNLFGIGLGVSHLAHHKHRKQRMEKMRHERGALMGPRARAGQFGPHGPRRLGGHGPGGDEQASFEARGPGAHGPGAHGAEPQRPGKKNASHLGPAREPGEGRLIFDLVHVMGGPKDPRVQKMMKTHQQERRQMRGELREAQERVQQAMTAEPFEQAALDGALASLREQSQAAQEKAQSGLADLGGQLTAEERSALKTRLEQEKKKPGPGR